MSLITPGTYGWFPRYNARGTRVTWEKPGQWQNQWLDDLTEIYHNGIALLVNGSRVGPAGNDVAAGGGRWASGVPTSEAIVWNGGTAIMGAAMPAINPRGDLVYVTAPHTNQKSLQFIGALGGTGVIDVGAISDLRISNTAVVYSKNGETWGARLDLGGAPQRIQVAAQEFRPIPIDTPGDPWVLNHTQTGIILRPFGETHGYRFDNGGQTFYPDGVWVGGILVAFSSGTGLLDERLFDVTAPRVDLSLPIVVVPPVTDPPPPPPPPPPDPIPEPPEVIPMRPSRQWLQPNIASNILDLFKPGVDILGNVQVMELVAQHFFSDPVVGPNTWRALLDAEVFQKLHDQGIGISLGMSAVTKEDPDGSRSLAELARFYHQLQDDTGLSLSYVSIDVPMTKNKKWVGAPVEVLADRVATFIKLAHSLDLKVAWAESWPEIPIDDQWNFLDRLDSLRKKGAESLPNYWHLDVDHNLKFPDAHLLDVVRNVQQDYSIPTAVILAGYKHTTDQEYEQDVIAYAKQLKAAGAPMDQLLLMAWVDGFQQPNNFTHIALLNTVVELFA